jgi:hypothetical protein
MPLIDPDTGLDDAPPSLGDDCLNWSLNSALHGPALPTDPSSSIYDDFSGAYAVSMDDCEDNSIDNAPEEHDLGWEAPQAAEPFFELQSPVLDTEGIVALFLVAFCV